MSKRAIGDRRTRARPAPLILAATALLMLSGCAGPVVGALTLGEISTLAGLVSTLVSGQDLTEHALSLATGKDCRILETLLREDRAFCEQPGAPATAHDFEGVASLFSTDMPVPTAKARPGLDSLDPMALGFAPIDRPFQFSALSLQGAEIGSNPIGADTWRAIPE